MSGRVGDAVELVRERVSREARRGQRGIGLQHIRPGLLELVQTVPAEELQGTLHAHRSGDLLFGRLRPAFRKLLRVEHAGVVSPEAWVLRVRPGHDTDYVLHRLAAPDVIAAAVASAKGSRMPRATWDAVADHGVCWPVLDEQRRRARPLKALDRARRADREAVAAAVSLAQARLASAAGEARPLGTVAQLQRRPAVVDPPAALPCVGVGDLDSADLSLERWGRAADARSRHDGLRRGDLLFARIRPRLRKVALAPVDGMVSPELLRLCARDPAAQGILALSLLDPGLAERAHRAATGTRMPRVHWSRLREVPVWWPSDPDGRLAALCDAVCGLVLAATDRRRAAAELREQLSQDLLL
jgi:hypothetical protein